MEILRCRALRQIEIVVEAVTGRRTDIEQDVVVKPTDGSGHHMGRAMPESFKLKVVFHK
jgi:hypothetical protein